MTVTEANVQLCPVCRGNGWLQNLPTYSTVKSVDAKKCHGCYGKGWVTVRLDYKVTYGSKCE